MPPGPLPPDPEDFHGGSDSADYVHYNWRKVEEAEYYHLYLKTEIGDWQRAAVVYPRDTGEEEWCRIVLKDLEPGTFYLFKLTSVNDFGESNGLIIEHYSNMPIEVTQKDPIDIFTPDNHPDSAYEVGKKDRHDINIRTIAPAGDVDYFKFTGEKGKTYGVQAAKLFFDDSYFDNFIMLSLYDAEMNLMDADYSLAFMHRGWDGLFEIENWECPHDGTYYVKAETHEEDNDGLGRYLFYFWTKDED